MKDKSILAIGFEGRWIIYSQRWLAVSLAGSMFWSAVIAAIQQMLALL